MSIKVVCKVVFHDIWLRLIIRDSVSGVSPSTAAGVIEGLCIEQCEELFSATLLTHIRNRTVTALTTAMGSSHSTNPVKYQVTNDVTDLQVRCK